MQTNANALTHRLCGFGAVLFVFGAIAYGGAMFGEARMDAAKTWPSVPGQITHSKVGTAIVKTGPVRRERDTANIHFTYSVNGRTYRGDSLRVVPMLHPRPEGTPTELVARYPVGANVEVFYDPNNPGDSLLLPRATAAARELTRSLGFIAISVALVGLLIAGVGGVNLYRARSATPAPVREDQPCVVATPTAAPSPVPEPTPAPPTKPRATHWLIRTAATLLGLFFILIGSLMFVVSPSAHNPAISTTTEIVARAIFFAIALFGGGLIYYGMKKPTQPLNVCS